jgi:hypothetical protein
MTDLDAIIRYGRALTMVETSGHRETEAAEMPAELALRRARERELRQRVGRLELENLRLRRTVSRRADR